MTIWCHKSYDTWFRRFTSILIYPLCIFNESVSTLVRHSPDTTPIFQNTSSKRCWVVIVSWIRAFDQHIMQYKAVRIIYLTYFYSNGGKKCSPSISENPTEIFWKEMVTLLRKWFHHKTFLCKSIIPKKSIGGNFTIRKFFTIRELNLFILYSLQ